MLTIRHIEPSGHETIVATKRVTSHPENQMSDRSIFWEREDGSTERIYEGVVYVMNDIGKTVAKYDLGESASRMSGASGGASSVGVAASATGGTGGSGGLQTLANQSASKYMSGFTQR